MFGSLYTGLTGLRSNQRYLEVVGNNLSNSVTQGYKADRITFKDLFYQTYRQASGPVGELGGVNAQQVGRGVTVGSIDVIHSQGDITPTGRNFDLALEGGGFFVLSNGSRNFYTRAGALDIDIDSNLVDQRTGLKVQNINGQDISLATNTTVPAQATSAITFAGNLPAAGYDPVAEVQDSATPFEDHRAAILTSTLGAAATVDLTNQTLTLTIDSASPVDIDFTAADFPAPLTLTQTAALINSKIQALGLTRSATASIDGAGQLQIASNSTGDNSLLQLSGTAATTLALPTTQAQGSEANAAATTDLNDLSANQVDYANGDVIRITGFDVDGAAVNITFTYGTDGTTLGDLVDTINNSGAYANATLTLGPTGGLSLRSNVTGDSELAISIRDVGTQTKTNWGSHAFDITTAGADARPVATSITIFDSLGIGHLVSGQFTRQDDGTWNLDLEIPADEGTLAGGPITNISFDANGVFQGSTGTSIDLTFNNGASPLTVDLDLGAAGSSNGLSQSGAEATAQSIDQDGYEAGVLAQFTITQGGVIQGRYSNGIVQDIDTLAIATFQNINGLAKEGGTLFVETDNSGQAQIGQGGVGSRGAVRAGALEGSNVDVAEQFVHLIEAQRAFQGNARVITTSDEVLQELVNIV